MTLGVCERDCMRRFSIQKHCRMMGAGWALQAELQGVLQGAQLLLVPQWAQAEQ